MSSSELGRVIRADRDYTDLLVKFKAEEPEDENEEAEEEVMIPEVPIDIKEEVVDDSKNIFDNLATLSLWLLLVNSRTSEETS